MNIFNPKFSLVADLRLIFQWSRRFTKWRTTRFLCRTVSIHIFVGSKRVLCDLD